MEISPEHLAADATFGPCSIPECPGSIWQTPSGRPALSLVAQPDPDEERGDRSGEHE